MFVLLLSSDLRCLRVFVSLMKADTTPGDAINQWQLLRSSLVTTDKLRKEERAPKSREFPHPRRLSFVR